MSAEDGREVAHEVAILCRECLLGRVAHAVSALGPGRALQLSAVAVEERCQACPPRDQTPYAGYHPEATR